MNEILSALLTTGGEELAKGVYNFYGLKEYTIVKYFKLFKPDSLSIIKAGDTNGDKFFWQKVFSQKLLPGDYIRLEGFHISTWFPRKPGLYWTHDAERARNWAFNNHSQQSSDGSITFDSIGKNLLTELGGIGTVNFNKGRDTVLITATSSGRTHEGIPLICNRQVWDNINSELKIRGKVKADLEGILVSIPPEFSSYFLTGSKVPKVALRISSLLNVKQSTSAVSVSVTPWTFFETNDESNPYGFAYITTILLQENIDQQTDRLMKYVDGLDGKTILTDFDEETNSLNAVFPLNQFMNGVIMDKKILEFCQSLRTKFYKEFL